MFSRFLWSDPIRSLCLVVSSISVLLPADAHANQNCGALDRVVVAIRVSEILYPAIKGKELSVQFSEGTGGPLSSATEVRSLLIAVHKPQWHPSPSSAASASVQASTDGEVDELPLYLNFSFIEYDSVERSRGVDLACRPLQFGSDKTSTVLADARTLVNAHPEWTDSQDVEALRRKGLRFGPEGRDALLRLIPLEGLKEFYGSLRVKNAMFSIANNRTKQAGSSFADLRWYIEAEETGTSRILTIIMEPFNGRVVGLSEHTEQLK